MQSFTNKVAVVTGAAQGIGLAIARRCAEEGMRVVLADVEDSRLHFCCEALRANGATVMAVRTDVSDSEQVQALAARTQQSFGRIDLVCNNAGVGVDGRLWELSLADFRWIFEVNFWGIVHGIQAFVPRMLAQGGPACIVNTASIAGLDSGAGLGAYRASKHAVVSLSETLHHDLRALRSEIQVSVLCPGLVRTRILDEGRRRSPSASLTQAPVAEHADVRQRREALEAGLAAGMEPEAVAHKLFEALREEQLHILTHPGSERDVQTRFRLILGQSAEQGTP